MHDVDLTEAPPLPEWLARDPAIQPSVTQPRHASPPTLRGASTLSDEASHDGPTLPTMDDVIGLPPPPGLVVSAERISVTPEADPNDWLLVALGVSASAVVLAMLIMLFGGGVSI